MDKQPYVTEAQRQLIFKQYMQVEKLNLKEMHNCIENQVNEMHLKKASYKETYHLPKDNVGLNVGNCTCSLKYKYLRRCPKRFN